MYAEESRARQYGRIVLDAVLQLRDLLLQLATWVRQTVQVDQRSTDVVVLL